MLSLSAMLALSGCNAMLDDVPLANPTVVIPSGFKVSIAGQAVPIEGFDECLRPGDLASRAADSSIGTGSCLLIPESRSNVSVRVILPSGPVIENWEIIREDVQGGARRTSKMTALRRPDGTLVGQLQSAAR